MLAGPSIARIVNQFDDEYNMYDDDPDTPNSHHEGGVSSQKAFQRQVSSLTTVIRTMGNPFSDDFPELVHLDSRNCANTCVADSIRSFEEIGKKQYCDYKKTVVTEGSKAIDETIKKNNLALFKRQVTKEPTKQAQKISSLKSNVSLLGQLYVVVQTRGYDLKDFFAHEIQSFPPSLSEYGSLRLPNTKSDLLKCLPMSDKNVVPPSNYYCIVLDGAVAVHSLQPNGASTFEDYAQNIFIPHVLYHLQHSERVDIVWDQYIDGSLKQSTREKRGTGVRRKVSSHAKVPSNWMTFLRDSANKSELFLFLSNRVSEFDFPAGKQVYITAGIADHFY